MHPFRTRIVATATVIACTVVGAAHGQHDGDIFVGVADARIVTGTVGPGGAAQVPHRVFAGQFGPAHFTSDPGFDAPAGTFPPGTRVGFNILAALERWNGDGFDPASGETLTISYFTSQVTTADGPVPGFDIAVQANGGWHRHLGFLLNPPPDEGAPSPGVYRLSLELYSTAAAIGTSDPFWILFLDGGDTASHAAAIAWMEGALACPADLDGDGNVGFADLLSLLAAWGPCAPGPCAADLDGDQDVGFADLLALLSVFGSCR